MLSNLLPSHEIKILSENPNQLQMKHTYYLYKLLDRRTIQYCVEDFQYYFVVNLVASFQPHQILN